MIAQSARTGCADGRVRRSSARQKKPARRSSVRRSRRGGVPKRRKGRLLGTLRANGAVAFAQGQTSVSVFSRRWARVVHGREWPEVERSGMQGGHPRRPDPHPSPTTPSGSRRRRFARHGRRSRQILQHIVERDRLRARADPARRQHRGQVEHQIAGRWNTRSRITTKAAEPGPMMTPARTSVTGTLPSRRMAPVSPREARWAEASPPGYRPPRQTMPFSAAGRLSRRSARPAPLRRCRATRAPPAPRVGVPPRARWSHAPASTGQGWCRRSRWRRSQTPT